jgi:hypothetical protein
MDRVPRAESSKRHTHTSCTDCRSLTAPRSRICAKCLFSRLRDDQAKGGKLGIKRRGKISGVQNHDGLAAEVDRNGPRSGEMEWPWRGTTFQDQPPIINSTAWHGRSIPWLRKRFSPVMLSTCQGEDIRASLPVVIEIHLSWKQIDDRPLGCHGPRKSREWKD